MEIFNALDQLNWFAVVGAALSSFVVGFVWYHPAVFGNVWMKLVKLTPKQVNSSEGMVSTYVMTGLMSFLTAAILGCLMVYAGISGWAEGLSFGVIIGFVIRGGAHVIHNGFARRSDTLTLIDAMHDTVAVALMGLILGFWL